MSLAYLAEHAERAILALDLAERESRHLAYTSGTLFNQPMDIEWVNSIASRDELAEKIDAFVARFGRLQDHIGDKLIPRFARLLGEQPRSLLDSLAYAEKMHWLESAEAFIGARRLRNQLIHEYMADPQLFLESLHTAREASQMLIEIVGRIRQQARSLHLH